MTPPETTSRARPAQPSDPATNARTGAILCPYCGTISANPRRCDRCLGYFDPLSRQASQNAMGPWFLRDAAHPFRPGMSYETLRDLIKRDKVNRMTILRGPATRQFWSFAGRTPSVANLLGVCHNCQSEVNPDAFSCAGCGAVFSPETDRQHLGLAPVHLLPGQAPPEMIAATHLPEIHAAAAAHAADVAAGLAGNREPAAERSPPAVVPPSGGSRLPLVAGAVAAGVLLGIGSAAMIWYALKDDVLAPVPLRAAGPVQAAPAPVQAEAAPQQAPADSVSEAPQPAAPPEADAGPPAPPPPTTPETGPAAADHEPPPPVKKTPDLKRLP
jgi:hypothetical protein